MGVPLSPKYKSRRMSFNIVDDVLNDRDDKAIPDLLVNINPDTFSQKFTKKITRTKTFNAILEEHWGDDLDTISCSGSTGAFLLEESDDANTQWTGLTTYHRQYTKPYKQFIKLIDIYKNNAAIYDPTTGAVIRMGYIIMNFDESIYRGYFDNFVVTEVGNVPFRFTFNFVFKVESTSVSL